MIEVMVAILVLALGMMGMLGMFINSLKISSGAMYRNTATQHAYMMADVIRANQVNLQNYFAPTATSTATCFTSTGCSTSQIPNTEYKVWETQLGNLLPAGQGLVCRDNAAASAARRPSPQTYAAFFTCASSVASPGQVVVKVCWDESRIQAGNRNVSNSDNTAANTNTGGLQCVYTAL